MEAVIDVALSAFLERGGAMIVGTASRDGEPHAQRGWGCSVVDPVTIRVLVDATDTVGLSHLGAGGRIAITSADVRDLRSVQVKGSSLGLEEPTSGDLDRCAAHNDELFTDIGETDFVPRVLSERMVPPGYVVCTVRVEEIFDQTPGPGAGAPVGGTMA